MHEITGNVMLGQNLCVQNCTEVIRLGMSKAVPRSYEDVRESIDWKKQVRAWRRFTGG